MKRKSVKRKINELTDELRKLFLRAHFGCYEKIAILFYFLYSSSQGEVLLAFVVSSAKMTGSALVTLHLKLGHMSRSGWGETFCCFDSGSSWAVLEKDNVGLLFLSTKGDGREILLVSK